MGSARDMLWELRQDVVRHSSEAFRPPEEGGDREAQVQD